ncbi:SSF1 protein, partial [Phaetusa simplex]|nr:SSF1 protein [Phaetusa simplex]
SKNQKTERAAALHQAQQEYSAVPHSFVFNRGRVGKNVRQLIADVRKVMEPYTARALKVRKNNSLKDFVAVAGPLGVTHFLVFSKSSSSINFVSSRNPPMTSGAHCQLVLSFSPSSLPQVLLLGAALQPFSAQPGFVPGIAISQVQDLALGLVELHEVNLNNIKRCLLISYDAETQLLDFRHYSLKVVPVGMNKAVKKLLQEKFPNMSRLEDISELLVKDINLSESEAEQDGTHNVLELPQAYAGRGNMKAQQSAVRLTEIGPRMTLQLIKVEEGLAQGNVLYHGFIHKTEAEVKEILARKEAKLQLKAERRQKQEADVERKRRQREAHREKSLVGIRRKRQQDGDSDAEDPGAPEQQDAGEQSEESDAEYYRQEVGEEPDKGESGGDRAPAVPSSCCHQKEKGGGDTGRNPPPRPEMATNLSHCENFSSFQESLWPVLAAQFPAALVGNGIAVYRFLARERSWHSGIVYSFHLAFSGMLYSLSLPFLAAYYYPPKHWRYGPVLCKLERFLFNCNLYGGIFFVTCISLNRYLGVVHPLRVHGRLRPHHAKVLSMVIWVLAGTFSAPTLFFAELQEAEGAIECLGSAVPQRLQEFYPYSLVLAALCCGLPFLLTTSCYAAIIRTVFRNPHLSQPEKRKVGILVGVGVALYAFSYLPYHIFRNLNLRRRLLPPGTEDCAVSRTIHTTAQVCKILVNLNICLHPLLYAALADSMQSCC